MNAIEVKKLKKSFGSVEALRGISFEVKQGEIYGLVGPDGAGKTTLMRILSGIMSADSGSVKVNGIDVLNEPEEVKPVIGYMSQRFSLYGDLSVRENLEFYADLFQIPAVERENRIRRLLEFSWLGEFLDRRANALSGGMKQKLGLSCALIHTPKILFLDEPTTGVDPVSRRELWMILYDLWKEGMTILISTPYLDEAERCGRLAFIHSGRLIIEGSPEEIKKSAEFSIIEVRVVDVIDTRKKLEAIEWLTDYTLLGENIHFISESVDDDIEKLKNKLVKAGISFKSMMKVDASLEDVFLNTIKSASN